MPRYSKLIDFVSERDRDAWATIRGYVYQVDSTILRWATLTENQVLELERGEDIDIVAPVVWKARATSRVLEQIKCLEGSISLRSKAALESLANFHEHRQANKGRDLFFRFSTTAVPSHERPAGALTYTPGIALWEKIRSDNAPNSVEKDSEAVSAFLRSARKPASFSEKTWKSFMAFLKRPDSDFHDFIRRFEWSTGTEASETLTARVHAIILANDQELRPADAASKYEHLFGHVIRLLATAPSRGARTLTRDDLVRALAKTTPDPELSRFVADFRELRDFLSQGLSVITSDLAEVKESTREILSRLPARKDLTPALERVVDPNAALDCFGSVSRALISWPQETNGTWIERPALQELEGLLRADAPRLAVLLGEPGSGKSALLSKLAVKLADSGAALLALKIDQMPRSVRTLQELDREWFPNCGLVDGVREIAKQKPVTVLIDQLDALASLIDQQSNRLEVVVQVIQALGRIPNVRVLLSCREFDFKYDTRFNSIHATKVYLTDPPWEAIEPILREGGIDTSQWSRESKELLRKPQHLSLFLTFLSSSVPARAFSSYEAMLETVFTERVIKPYGAATARTCEAIAAAMATSGEIWLPVLQFDAEHRDNVEQLRAAGILRRESRLLGFQHQTMFDYVRVRTFCSGAQSLSSYVSEHQGALFVRSTLWAAATSMRSMARGLYHKEVGAIWRDPALRKHVRFLLIAFIGQFADPDEEETQWLLPALDGPMRDKALLSMFGSPGWFARLRARLPILMGSDDEQLCWELSLVFRGALNFDRQAVIDLIRRCWAEKKSDVFVLSVFRETKNWDPNSVGIVKGIVARSKVDPFYIQQACESMISTYPELAADLLVTRLESEPVEAGESAESILLSQDWWGIEKLGEQAPWPMLQQLWPWLRGLVGYPERGYARNAVEYRRERNYELNEEIGTWGLLRLAVKLLEHAAEDAERFKEFLAAEAGTELMILHRLLSYGLRCLAPSSPETVLGYLTGDARRLNLGGTYSKPRLETEMLIAAVVPHLDDPGAAELEQYILRSHYYQDFSQGGPEWRRERRKLDRLRQLELLGAFPLKRLSASARRLRREKGIALRAKPVSGDDRFGLIGSPMSVESMEKASKEAILKLFTELEDPTGFHHPRDPMRGGAQQASQAFGELAKRQPHKVIDVVHALRAGHDESAAAQAIQGLSKAAEVPPQLLIDLVHRLDRAGFRSSDFRRTVSWALADVSARGKGLTDKTCDLLESWLEPAEEVAADPASPGIFGEVAAGRPQSAKLLKPKEGPKSILWGHGLGLFAHGNYPVLRAITYGFLNRDKPDTDSWTAVLQRHLAVHEDPRVWTSLLLDLRNLRMTKNAKRAADFASQLMRRQPAALRSAEGLMFIAWNHARLPAVLSERCLRIWRTRKWQGRDQAIGEFSLLRSVQVADSGAWNRNVEDALSESGRPSGQLQALRVGIAFAAINLWTEPALRGACHRVILRLLPLADDELARVLMDIFRVSNPMPPDRFTVELINRVISEPKMLAHPWMLGRCLERLLADGLDPHLVARASKAILDGAGQQTGNIRGWAVESRHLIQIAMTLQKIEVARDAGLELFERLMDLGAYEVDQVLREVDRKLI